MPTSEFTHSFFGHPVMAVLNLLGMRRAAAWVHDVALPVPVEPVAVPTTEQHPVIPVETCEAWGEREWLWWVVKYRHKPGAVDVTMAARFPLRSSALTVAAAVKAAHRDGVVLGVGGAQ
ncbi:hypothetical protein [Azospirillum argentinense]